MVKNNQLKDYAVCQKCGRWIDMQTAIPDGWLVAPFVQDPEYNIVRCFRHITYKALMQSYAGRTKYWLRAMYEGQRRAIEEDSNPATKHIYNPAIAPFPLKDKEVESD